MRPYRVVAILRLELVGAHQHPPQTRRHGGSDVCDDVVADHGDLTGWRLQAVTERFEKGGIRLAENCGRRAGRVFQRRQDRPNVKL